MKAVISRSRSQRIRSAGDCTRPAESPYRTFFQMIPERSYPTRRSRTRRASCALRRLVSMSRGCLRASRIASFVISLNVTRLIGAFTFFPPAGGCMSNSSMCHAIASPSRSGSGARIISLAECASSRNSVTMCSFPFEISYVGTNPAGISIAFFCDFGRSRMCPIDARTVYAPSRYFSIVFAFDGDSTINNFI